MREARFGPKRDQPKKEKNGGGHYCRDEIAETLSARRWSGAGCVRSLTSFTICASMFRCRRAPPHDETAVGDQRAASDLVTGGLFDRHGLARHIDSSTALAHRGLFRRPECARQDGRGGVAGFYLIERNVLFGSGGIEQVRRCGEDSAARESLRWCSAWRVFQDLSRRTSVVITAALRNKRRGAAHSTKGSRKDLREKSGENAIEVRGAGAQSISVNMFGLRLMSEDQKRTKKGQPPQRNDRVARRNSTTFRRPASDARQMIRRAWKQQDRKRKRRAHPKTQAHGIVFGIGFHLRESVHRL